MLFFIQYSQFELLKPKGQLQMCTAQRKKKKRTLKEGSTFSVTNHYLHFRSIGNNYKMSLYGGENVCFSEVVRYHSYKIPAGGFMQATYN